MEVNNIYTLDQIIKEGFLEKEAPRENAKIFLKGDKVYFFECIANKQLRLYTVINKKSFFL